MLSVEIEPTTEVAEVNSGRLTLENAFMGSGTSALLEQKETQ